MLHTKNGDNWLVSFHNEVKNVKVLTNDAWHTMNDLDHVIAIGHMSDSGDLKTHLFYKTYRIYQFTKDGKSAFKSKY